MLLKNQKNIMLKNSKICVKNIEEKICVQTF